MVADVPMDGVGEDEEAAPIGSGVAVGASLIGATAGAVPPEAASVVLEVSDTVRVGRGFEGDEVRFVEDAWATAEVG
jgi:hypothetical protein